jgi:hypothetical protein
VAGDPARLVRGTTLMNLSRSLDSGSTVSSISILTMVLRLVKP